MHQPRAVSSSQSRTGILETNKVLRNTYALLAMTLLFSAFTAWLSMALHIPHPGVVITLIGYFGLLFLTQRFSHSAWSLLFVFMLTGFMGMTLGPILGLYLKVLPDGDQIVMMALGGTGLTFLGMSAYALVSRKDFSFLNGFLFTGILVAFLAGLGAIFFHLPGLALAVSAMFTVLMAGLILFETSRIVHGGENNYILATVSLYVAIYNLFTSLLHILGFLAGDE